MNYEDLHSSFRRSSGIANPLSYELVQYRTGTPSHRSFYIVSFLMIPPFALLNQIMHYLNESQAQCPYFGLMPNDNESEQLSRCLQAMHNVNYNLSSALLWPGNYTIITHCGH